MIFEAWWAKACSNQSTLKWHTICEANMIVGCRMHKPHAVHGAAELLRKCNKKVKILCCVDTGGSADQIYLVSASRIRRHIRTRIQNTRHGLAPERSRSFSTIAQSYFEWPFVISHRPCHHLLIHVTKCQICPVCMLAISAPEKNLLMDS